MIHFQRLITAWAALLRDGYRVPKMRGRQRFAYPRRADTVIPYART